MRQLAVSPRWHRTHWPQLIWNGTMTRSPNDALVTSSDVDDLADAFVADRERTLEDRVSMDQGCVEVTRGNDGEHQRISGPLECRFGMSRHSKRPGPRK